MNENELQRQIDELKKRMDSLDQANTIPLNTEKAFVNRGFLQEKTFIIFGSGTLSGAGDYDLVIPGANANSIVLTQSWVGSPHVEAQIVESPTFPGQYQIRAEGTATSQFSFMVFLLTGVARTTN